MKVNYKYWINYLNNSRCGTRTIRNMLLDMRYGAFLGGNIDTKYADLGAIDTVNTGYEYLPKIFKGRINISDVLVDVGCGKGRVINWWLSQGLQNKIIGIELDADIARRLRERLKKYKNVHIITGDAVQNNPEEGTVFYLYNPFKEYVMVKYKQKMEDMFRNNRDIIILYFDPVCVDIFKCDPLWEVEEREIQGYEAIGTKIYAIIKKKPMP